MGTCRPCSGNRKSSGDGERKRRRRGIRLPASPGGQHREDPRLRPGAVAKILLAVVHHSKIGGNVSDGSNADELHPSQAPQVFFRSTASNGPALVAAPRMALCATISVVSARSVSG
jgi:hypothetical protein